LTHAATGNNESNHAGNAVILTGSQVVETVQGGSKNWIFFLLFNTFSFVKMRSAPAYMFYVLNTVIKVICSTIKCITFSEDHPVTIVGVAGN
jgi:hypothetical protein